jgi:hypothetical protein
VNSASLGSPSIAFTLRPLSNWLCIAIANAAHMASFVFTVLLLERSSGARGLLARRLRRFGNCVFVE